MRARYIKIDETKRRKTSVDSASFEALKGIDRNRKKLVIQMIREIQEERAIEAWDG
jgi:hypothetical protein